jgi:hypothetical protein
LTRLEKLQALDSGNMQRTRRIKNQLSLKYDLGSVPASFGTHFSYTVKINEIILLMKLIAVDPSNHNKPLNVFYWHKAEASNVKTGFIYTYITAAFK